MGEWEIQGGEGGGGEVPSTKYRRSDETTDSKPRHADQRRKGAWGFPSLFCIGAQSTVFSNEWPCLCTKRLRPLKLFPAPHHESKSIYHSPPTVCIIFVPPLSPLTTILPQYPSTTLAALNQAHSYPSSPSPSYPYGYSPSPSS